MPEPADQPAKHGRSLVGFYIALGAVAALMSLGVLLTPLVQLHYHSWQYRAGKDAKGTHLCSAMIRLLEEHADERRMLSLLGPPHSRESEDGALWHTYMYKQDRTGASGFSARVADGRVVEVAGCAVRRRAD